MTIPAKYFGRVVDAHVHIQPWREMKPAAIEVMLRGRRTREDAHAIMDDPRRLLALMDRDGIARVAMVNYVAPEVIGFTEAVNEFVAGYARTSPERLVAIGSVHPRRTTDPAGDVSRLRDLGIRALKIHPPHQEFAPNAYREGLEALAAIYRRAEEISMPVYVHTGTSVFPGARSRLGDPMLADDVAVDFPRLPIVLCHAGRPLWYDEAFFLARRHRNVFLDLSSIPPAGLLEGLPRLAEISEKVLFGTDWPAPGVPGIAENAESFLALSLSNETAERVLVANADRLFPPA
jgi:hypothetical protein